MIIKKACATFGCLDNRTLEFNDNFNFLCMDNEAGKSTWCAFIRVMLYGIDTRDRDRAPTAANPLGHIADKNRYAPWNGKPMSGSLIVEHDGREIEILRSNSRGGAMQNFSAKFTDTSEPVPYLTASNCGEVLCGVSAEVYEKSAFIPSGSVICAGESSELESRINSLATTGDDHNGASILSQRLNKFKNTLRSNSSNGAIPRETNILHELDNKISGLRRLSAEEMSLHTQIKDNSDKIDRISAQLDTLDAYEKWEALQKLSESEQALKKAEAALEQAKSDALANGRQLSEQFIAEARQKLAAAHAAEKELSAVKERIAPCEKLFLELQGQLSSDNGEQPTLKKISFIPFAFAAFFALLSIALTVIKSALLPAALTVTCLWLLFCTGYFAFIKLKNKDIAAKLAADAQALETKRAQFADIEAEHKKVQSELSQTRAKAADCFFKLAELISPFCPGISDAQQAEEFLNGCQDKISALVKAQYEYDAACEKYDSMSRSAGNLTDVCKPDTPKPESNREDFTVQKEQLVEAVHSLERRCAAIKGEMSAVGDIAVLSAQREQSEALIGLLQKRYDAVLLADRVLNETAAEISAKISAPLSRQAEQYLSALTGGKYKKFELCDKFRAACSQNGSELPIPAEKLSSGAADALYLAFRLAVCDLVLDKQNPPLILDDALLTFDDRRTGLALDLLAETAKTRQIIFFCCKRSLQ